jgi:hypothetical protein
LEEDILRRKHGNFARVSTIMGKPSKSYVFSSAIPTWH